VFPPKRGFGRLAIGGLRVVHGRKVDRVSERGGDLGTESRKDLADAELEGSELRTSVTRWL